MQTQVPRGRVAYEPSSLEADSARETMRGFRTAATTESGEKGRVRHEHFADHYSQARMFFRSQTQPEQAHIASALVFELSKVETAAVRERMVGHLRNIDEALAKRVAAGLGLASLPLAPTPAAPVRNMPPSPPLQLIGKMKDTLEGRAIGVLVADGSDAKLLLAIKTAAVAAGASVKVIAPKIGGATLSDGKLHPADGQLAGTPSVMFDAVAVLLAKASAAALSREAAAIDFVRDAFGHLKAIAVDEGGRSLLTAAGVTADGAVVDARKPKAFVDAAKTRAWEREPSVRTLA